MISFTNEFRSLSESGDPWRVIREVETALSEYRALAISNRKFKKEPATGFSAGASYNFDQQSAIRQRLTEAIRRAKELCAAAMLELKAVESAMAGVTNDRQLLQNASPKAEYEAAEAELQGYQTYLQKLLHDLDAVLHRASREQEQYGADTHIAKAPPNLPPSPYERAVGRFGNLFANAPRFVSGEKRAMEESLRAQNDSAQEFKKQAEHLPTVKDGQLLRTRRIENRFAAGREAERRVQAQHKKNLEVLEDLEKKKQFVREMLKHTVRDEREVDHPDPGRSSSSNEREIREQYDALRSATKSLAETEQEQESGLSIARQRHWPWGEPQSADEKIGRWLDKYLEKRNKLIREGKDPSELPIPDLGAIQRGMK